MDCSSDPADIAVVVVAHESAATIDECLGRLRSAAGVAEMRVVDNDSQDGTLDIIQRHAAADARLRFIGNPDNPGLAVACNQGAAACSAPWLAFVSPYLMVEADSLQRLRSHAAQAGAALLGVDLVDEHGRHDPAARRRAPDFAAMLASPAASRLAVPRDPALALQPVEAVSGALMLLPRLLFERLRGFDEGYRLHVEDLDLCRRARELGALVGVANDIRVLHLRGVSSCHKPLFVEWHRHRGLWRYFRKFESGRRSLPMRLALRCMLEGHFLAVAARRLLRR